MLSTIIGIVVLAIIILNFAATGWSALKLTKNESPAFRLGVVVMSVVNEMLDMGKTVLYLLGFLFIVLAAWSLL